MRRGRITISLRQKNGRVRERQLEGEVTRDGLVLANGMRVTRR